MYFIIGCLIFCVPTCVIFWYFMFELQKKEDEFVEKMFDDDRQDFDNLKK